MKVRIRYVKLGKVRWTSHRDVARIWERAFRRAELPLAYSEGFSPRPRVSFGLALPTGCESEAEYLDVDVREALDLATLPDRLSAALPAGIDVAEVGPAPDGRGASLQQQVTSCTWTVVVAGLDEAGTAALVDDIRCAPALPVTRERKGRPVDDDLRPAVLAIEAVAVTGDGAELVFELATQPRGVRPTEVLEAVRPGVEVGLVRRTHQWIERDGARRHPLEPPAATNAPHAEVRAS